MFKGPGIVGPLRASSFWRSGRHCPAAGRWFGGLCGWGGWCPTSSGGGTCCWGRGSERGGPGRGGRVWVVPGSGSKQPVSVLKRGCVLRVGSAAPPGGGAGRWWHAVSAGPACRQAQCGGVLSRPRATSVVRGTGRRRLVRKPARAVVLPALVLVGPARPTLAARGPPPLFFSCSFPAPLWARPGCVVGGVWAAPTPRLSCFCAGGGVWCVLGGVLLSRPLAGTVPSALAGLASGFGMGPGVTLPL